MHLAIGFGLTEVISLLLSHPRLDVNLGHPLDYAIMHYNVIGFSKKSVEMVSLLLTHPGLDVNLKDGDETPLFRAIIKNSTEMVKLLVEDKRLDISIESFGN